VIQVFAYLIITAQSKRCDVLLIILQAKLEKCKGKSKCFRLQDIPVCGLFSLSNEKEVSNNYNEK